MRYINKAVDLRTLVLLASLVLTACGGGGGGGNAGGGNDTALGSAPDGLVPSNGVAYAINIRNNFVNRVGCLLVYPRIVPFGSDVNFNNGPNGRDIGIFSGDPISGEPGAIWWGTNTSMCGFANVNCNLLFSGLDIAWVAVNEPAGTVQVRVDGQLFGLPSARTGTLNIFTTDSSIFTPVNHILDGFVDLQFADEGRSVSGNFLFFGDQGFQYSATLSGTFVERCTF